MSQSKSIVWGARPGFGEIGSVAKRGEFSRFVGFLAQKGGQIFEDGELWELFKKGGILKNFTKIGKFSYFSTKC